MEYYTWSNEIVFEEIWNMVFGIDLRRQKTGIKGKWSTMLTARLRKTEKWQYNTYIRVMWDAILRERINMKKLYCFSFFESNWKLIRLALNFACSFLRADETFLTPHTLAHTSHKRFIKSVVRIHFGSFRFDAIMTISIFGLLIQSTKWIYHIESHVCAVCICLHQEPHRIHI